MKKEIVRSMRDYVNAETVFFCFLQYSGLGVVTCQ